MTLNVLVFYEAVNLVPPSRAVIVVDSITESVALFWWALKSASVGEADKTGSFRQHFSSLQKGISLHHGDD